MEKYLSINLEIRSNDKSNDYIFNFKNNEYSIDDIKKSDYFNLTITLKDDENPFIFNFDEFSNALAKLKIDNKIKELGINLYLSDFYNEFIFKSKNPKKLEKLEIIEMMNNNKGTTTFDVSDSFKNKFDKIKFIIYSNIKLRLGFIDKVPNNIKFDLSSVRDFIIYNSKYSFDKFFNFFFDEYDINQNISIYENVMFLVENCEQIEKIAHFWLNVNLKYYAGNLNCNKDLEITDTSAFWHNDSNISSLSENKIFTFNSLKMQNVAYGKFDFNFDSDFEEVFNNKVSLEELSGDELTFNFEKPIKIKLLNSKGYEIHLKGKYDSILNSQITLGGNFSYDYIYFHKDFIHAILKKPKIIKIDGKISNELPIKNIILFFNLNDINSIDDLIKSNILNDIIQFLTFFNKNIVSIDTVKILIKDENNSLTESLEKTLYDFLDNIKITQRSENEIKYILNYFKFKNIF